jgi:ABC-type amino acid transport substrate-binding protein
MSANVSWDGMVALVSRGVADIGITNFAVTKKRADVVEFTDTLGFGK